MGGHVNNHFSGGNKGKVEQHEGNACQGVERCLHAVTFEEVEKIFCNGGNRTCQVALRFGRVVIWYMYLSSVGRLILSCRHPT